MEQEGGVEQDTQLERMMLTGMYGTVGMEQPTKRVGEEMEQAGKRNKRWKYAPVEEGWGEWEPNPTPHEDKLGQIGTEGGTTKSKPPPNGTPETVPSVQTEEPDPVPPTNPRSTSKQQSILECWNKHQVGLVKSNIQPQIVGLLKMEPFLGLGETKCDTTQAKSQPQLVVAQTNEQSHSEGVEYRCNMCDYQATSTGNLKKHQKSAHEGDTEYVRCVNLDGNCERHGTPLCEKKVRVKYWDEGRNGQYKYKYRIRKVLICSSTKFQIPGGSTHRTTQGEHNIIPAESESLERVKRLRSGSPKSSLIGD